VVVVEEEEEGYIVWPSLSYTPLAQPPTRQGQQEEAF
jgi:hypothetical protein